MSTRLAQGLDSNWGSVGPQAWLLTMRLSHLPPHRAAQPGLAQPLPWVGWYSVELEEITDNWSFFGQKWAIFGLQNFMWLNLLPIHDTCTRVQWPPMRQDPARWSHLDLTPTPRKEYVFPHFTHEEREARETKALAQALRPGGRPVRSPSWLSPHHHCPQQPCCPDTRA